jgi:hypothetical protein
MRHPLVAAARRQGSSITDIAMDPPGTGVGGGLIGTNT